MWVDSCAYPGLPAPSMLRMFVAGLRIRCGFRLRVYKTLLVHWLDTRTPACTFAEIHPGWVPSLGYFAPLLGVHYATRWPNLLHFTQGPFGVIPDSIPMSPPRPPRFPTPESKVEGNRLSYLSGEAHAPMPSLTEDFQPTTVSPHHWMTEENLCGTYYQHDVTLAHR